MLLLPPFTTEGTRRSPWMSGLVGYWKLDEVSGSRFDLSGNGNHLYGLAGQSMPLWI